MIQKTLKYIAGLSSILLIAVCMTSFYPTKQVNPQPPSTLPLLQESMVRYWLKKPQQLLQQRPLSHPQTLIDIYTSIDYEMLWVDKKNLSSAGKSLLQQLEETSADRLLNYQYHLPHIHQHLHKLARGRSPKVAATVDVLLTDAYISYTADILNDRLLPEHLTQHQADLLPASLLQPNQPNDQTAAHKYIATRLSEHHKLKQLNSMVRRLFPSHPAYIKLRLALQRYQKLVPHWRPIDQGPTIKPEEKHFQVLQLRELLVLYGDHPRPDTQTAPNSISEPSFHSRAQTFDPSLVASLKQFQRRHGMIDHGILDQETRSHLNTPPKQRIRQLALNMKRWRKLPNDLGNHHIWVNLADYNLKLINSGETELEMKVIIGKTERMTPEMHASIITLVLNPHWNIPDTIAHEDILPQVKKSPDYLAKNNMRILEGWVDPNEIDPELIDWQSQTPENFKYRFQQVSGPSNALGKVKFVLPNDNSIYLHDTNNPKLFHEKVRSFSSGCIRLEKPLDLAKALLKADDSWDEDKILATIEKGNTKHVRLPQAIPTYLTYLTAWVDKDNLLHFREDIYQHDDIINHWVPTTIQL